MKSTCLLIAFMICIIPGFMGCSVLFNESMNTKDLSDSSKPGPAAYRAVTKEAQAAIDLLKEGKDPGRILNGGATVELMNTYKENNSGVPADTRGMPAVKPSTSATRPKITLVMKEGGPGEYYWINKEEKGWSGITCIDCYLGYTIKGFSVKGFINYNDYIMDDYYYTTAIFQDDHPFGSDRYIVDKMPSARHNSGWGQGNYLVNELETEECDEQSYDYYMYYDGYYYPTDTYYYYYYYTNVPSATFESTESGPIPETWYWDPPYRFDEINMRIDRNGSIYYDAVTSRGTAPETLVLRYHYADFRVLYRGSSGLYSQGWRIKDIEVENGIVTAVLKQDTYNEKIFVYYSDTVINQSIGPAWDAGYRGVTIDASW